MATYAVWDKAYEHLVESGFEAYPPYTKKGKCTNDYLVLRDDSVAQISTFSSETHYYSVLCYSCRYSDLLKLVDSVKESMVGLAPMLMPAGIQTPCVYDDSYDAYMISIQYRASVRNRLLGKGNNING